MPSTLHLTTPANFKSHNRKNAVLVVGIICHTYLWMVLSVNSRLLRKCYRALLSNLMSAFVSREIFENPTKQMTCAVQTTSAGTCMELTRAGSELVQTHRLANTLALNLPPIRPGDSIFNIVKSDSYFLRLNSSPARPSRIIDVGSGTTTVVTPSAKLACTLPGMPSPAIRPAPA